MHLLLQFCLACSIIAGCLTIRRLPDCSLVRCAKPDCLDYYKPPNQCCPICKQKQPCYYNGKLYQHGERFKEECNTCWCSNGSVGCTKMGCLGKMGTCPLQDKPDVAGTCVHECSSDYDCAGAQKCCSNGCGHVCMTPTQNPKTCKVNGITYQEGERVPSGRCMYCTCTAGAVKCLALPCVPLPTTEPLPIA